MVVVDFVAVRLVNAPELAVVFWAYIEVEVALVVVPLFAVKVLSAALPVTVRVPFEVREEVAVRVPARVLPCNVVEARDAEEVAVRVPKVAL